MDHNGEASSMESGVGLRGKQNAGVVECCRECHTNHDHKEGQRGMVTMEKDRRLVEEKSYRNIFRSVGHVGTKRSTGRNLPIISRAKETLEHVERQSSTKGGRKALKLLRSVHLL